MCWAFNRQQDEPEDYIIATGEHHSFREFIELAANELGMEIEWQGRGKNEKGYDVRSGESFVAVDPGYYRPTEVDSLLGDASKAKQKLGWSPMT